MRRIAACIEDHHNDRVQTFQDVAVGEVVFQPSARCRCERSLAEAQIRRAFRVHLASDEQSGGSDPTAQIDGLHLMHLQHPKWDQVLGPRLVRRYGPGAVTAEVLRQIFA